MHPGWHSVMPCRYSASEEYTALESRQLDLPLEMPPLGQEQHKSLRDLAAVPVYRHGYHFAEVTQHLFSSMRSMRVQKDAAYWSTLRSAGKFCHTQLEACACQLRIRIPKQATFAHEVVMLEVRLSHDSNQALAGNLGPSRCLSKPRSQIFLRKLGSFIQSSPAAWQDQGPHRFAEPGQMTVHQTVTLQAESLHQTLIAYSRDVALLNNAAGGKVWNWPALYNHCHCCAWA